MVLSTGAKKYGAKILEHCSVKNTIQRSDGYWDVVTDKGTIKTLHLINSAGMFTTPRRLKSVTVQCSSSIIIYVVIKGFGRGT